MHAGTQANAGEADEFNRYSRIQVSPIAGPIGAEVQCGDVKALDDEAVAEIRRAWLDHLVILIRGQQLDHEEQMSFSGRFGPLQKSASIPIGQKPRFNPFVVVISNVLEDGVPVGSLGDGEALWHTDMSNTEIPPCASILYALEVPPTGGETGFLNMYHALETLPPELRSRVDGLTIRHDGKFNSAGTVRNLAASTSHPIVRTHPETKRNALYLGRRPHAAVNGLPDDESEMLLGALWAHATRPQFAWHHRWEAGDILMWDNRCAMHHRNAFDPRERRLMHRNTVVGTRPVTEPHSLLSSHPRSGLA